MIKDKSMLFLWVCIMSSLILQCPAPDPRVTRGLTHSNLKSHNSGALSQHLLIGCCLRLVGQSIVRAPSPSSLSFRSHCFLRPLSPFLYHRLSRPATRALSRPVSHPAVFTGDESHEKRERAGGMKPEGSTYISVCVTCSRIHGCLPRSMLWALCGCAQVLCVFHVWGKQEGLKGWQVHSEAQESSLTWLSHCAQIKSAFPASHWVRSCACMCDSITKQLSLQPAH